VEYFNYGQMTEIVKSFFFLALRVRWFFCIRRNIQTTQNSRSFCLKRVTAFQMRLRCRYITQSPVSLVCCPHAGTHHVGSTAPACARPQLAAGRLRHHPASRYRAGIPSFRFRLYKEIAAFVFPCRTLFFHQIVR
jgi:hypothetical protein